MFKLDTIEVKPGTRRNAKLQVVRKPDGSDLSIPLIIINGVEEGPCLLVSGGCHPDEVESFLAIVDIARELDPKRLTGTFIGAPVINIPGWLHKISADVSSIRENPIDMKNLNRTYPGKSDGTVTERMAHTIVNKILPQVNYAIDIHAGGTRGTSINMVGFIAADSELGRKSLELAKLFPMDIVWRSPPWGKFPTVAAEKEVTVIAVEVTGQGKYKDEDVRLCKVGIKNIMKHLGMIEGSPEEIPSRRRYIDSETYIYASVGGFLRHKTKTGDLASKGEELGENLDVYGNVTETFKAPFDCIVTGIRTKPVVWAGEPVFLVSSFVPDPSKELVPTKVEEDVTPP